MNLNNRLVSVSCNLLILKGKKNRRTERNVKETKLVSTDAVAPLVSADKI